MIRALRLLPAALFPVAGLLAAFQAFPARAAPPRPDVLLIVSEDTSPDFGCYGDSTVATPRWIQMD